MLCEAFEMSSLTVRTKRRSRGAETLLVAANRILKILGVNTSKHIKQPTHKTKISGRPQSPAVGQQPQIHHQQQKQEPTVEMAPPAPAAPPQPSPKSPSPDTMVDPNPNVKKSAKDFIFGRVIGEGCFSTVYLAKYIHTGKEYAIKVCEKKHILRERKAECIKREKEVLNMLYHATHGFVKLFCTFQDPERLYFVITFAKNGELLTHINNVGSFDRECARFYTAELVLALEEMHQRGIIHRDLKPENILLDDKMHMMVTDFGSAKLLVPENTDNKKDGEDSDEKDGCEERSRSRRKSFEGTAQYVSPEQLTDKTVSRASDLWALGCIIYQMVSGLPPFRGGNEYLIFQKIINLDYQFPEGFSPEAKDLVEKLLVLEPLSRLGARDGDYRYDSIKSHPFFAGLDWENLRETKPPRIYPYVPGCTQDESIASQYRVPDNLEPGLGDLQLWRLWGLELKDPAPTIQPPPRPQPSGILDIPPDEYRRRLEKQEEHNKWHQFVDGNLILKQGLVDKRKGLFARRRMLLLTTGPRLFYVDPVNMVVKGEIPWSKDLWVEAKNFRIFFIHTPNRTYYLEDPESFALEWRNAIEAVYRSTYPRSPYPNNNSSST